MLLQRKTHRFELQNKVANRYPTTEYIPDHLQIQINNNNHSPSSNECIEEKHVTINIIPPLDELLFHSNSPSLVLQNQDTLTIKKYFQDRETEEYSAGYVNFYKLHVLLHNIAEKKPNARNQFIKLLDKEWMKYYHFAQQAALKISKSPASKPLMINILKFNEFVWINKHNFNHLILKHDAMSSENNKLEYIFDWKLNYNPQNMLFPLIKQISNLYANENNNTGPKLNKINSQNFERENIKYWVRDSDIFQVIGVIIQHLPIYIYQNSKLKTKTSKKSRKKNNNSVYQKISSVYLDNDDFKCYHERIQKQQNAKSTRIRWYQKTMPRPSDIVYFERKVHKCGEPSQKDRFKLKSDEIISFINDADDDMENDMDENMNDLQSEIYNLIKTFDLKPVTRTVYKRIAFQFNNSNALRISLDLDLKFIKEKNNLLQKGQWYTQFDHIYEENVCQYSMCVLEIKLGREYVENPPQWMQELMDSDLLVECYKFSKYGESVNTFYSDKINFIPKWRTENAENDKLIVTKSESKTIANENKFSQTGESENKLVNKQNQKTMKVHVQKRTENKKESTGYSCDCCLVKLCKGNDKSSKKPVNPKVYFSNERTFLGWFQAAVFIGGSGLTIHSIDSNDIAGYLLIFVAFIVLLWAIFIYYKRNFRLLKGSLEGLHDMYGPIILVSVICFVFAYSLISGNGNVGP